MATYHDLVQEKDKVIRYLWRISVGLVLALLLSMWGWKNSQQDITLYYPPNLNVSSALKIAQIPEETIYAFVPLILQQLYLWEESGDINYEENSYRLRQFLTTDFQRTIHNEAVQGKQKGTLRGVQRSLQVIPSSIYNESSVQPVGDHWIVWIDVEIRDIVNRIEVYRGIHRMSVRVVRYDINREFNPWQIALDGIENDEPLIDEKEALRLQVDEKKKS